MRVPARYAWAGGAALIVAVLTAAVTLLGPSDAASQAGVTWGTQSTLTDYQSTDTTGGKTSSTQTVTVTSHQTSSEGEQLDDTQTFHQGADGTSYDHQSITDVKPDGTTDSNTWDDYRDPSGNRTSNTRDTHVDPDGNRTTTTTTDQFDGQGHRTSHNENTTHDKVEPPKPPKPPEPKKKEEKKEEKKGPESPKEPEPPKKAPEPPKRPSQPPTSGVGDQLSFSAVADVQISQGQLKHSETHHMEAAYTPYPGSGSNCTTGMRAGERCPFVMSTLHASATAQWPKGSHTATSVTPDPGVKAEITFGTHGATLRIGGLTLAGMSPDEDDEHYIGICSAQTWEPMQFDLTAEELSHFSTLSKTLAISSPYGVNSCIGSGSLVVTGHSAGAGTGTPPDVSGSITVNGDIFPMVIDQPGQQGRAGFPLIPGQKVTVRVVGNTIGPVKVRLLGASGWEMTTTSSSATSFTLSTQTAKTRGTYTIVVEPSAGRVGKIELAVTSP